MVSVYPDNGSLSRDYSDADGAAIDGAYLLVKTGDRVVAIYAPGSWNRVNVTP